MRISSYTLYAYDLPLTRPMAVRGSRTMTREGALLMVESEAGAIGWGDIAPLPGISRETLPEAIGVVRRGMEKLLQTELTAPDVLARPAMSCGSAAFGMDSAVLDCMAAESGLPVRHIFSDEAPEWVVVNALLDGPEPEILAAARAAVSAGYRSFKLKVGRGEDPRKEAARVRRIASCLGAGIGLRLDANQAWSLSDAKAFLADLGDLPIDYIEEPLRDPAELPELDVPVALDESLSHPEWESMGAVAAVIKPSVQDGVAGAVRLAGRARAQGMRPVVSSLFESGIGLQALASLAAGIAPGELPHGLDTLSWFVEDVASPSPRVTRGHMPTERASMVLLNPGVRRMGPT